MSEGFRVPLQHRIARPVLKVVFQNLFRMLGKVTLCGQENIPYGTPYVVAMNHVSIYDPPLAAAFWPETIEIIGAVDVFDKPGQGQLLRAYGVIPVHRGDYDRALLNKIIRILVSGHPLLIAPEGRRSHVTAMQRARPGIAYIVEKTHAAVVPLGIVGTTGDFWQRARRGERPPLEMHIGRPILLPEISSRGADRQAARQHNADLVMCHIAGLLPLEYRGVYAESALFPS